MPLNSVSPPVFALDHWGQFSFLSFCPSHLPQEACNSHPTLHTKYPIASIRSTEESKILNWRKKRETETKTQRHSKKDNERGVSLKTKHVESQKIHPKSLVLKGQDRGSI